MERTYGLRLKPIAATIESGPCEVVREAVREPAARSPTSAQHPRPRVDLLPCATYKNPNSGEIASSPGFLPGDAAFLSIGKDNIIRFVRLRDESEGYLDGDFREAHVSTEPHRSQAASRLPQAHADRWWAKGSRSPSRQGPQASVCLVQAQARLSLY